MASAPRVARTAPGRGSVQPSSHAAAAAAIVQPAAMGTKPSARNDSRAPASESSSQAHGCPRRTSVLREARSAATATATAQASKAAVVERGSSRKPMPAPSRPA